MSYIFQYGKKALAEKVYPGNALFIDVHVINDDVLI